MDGLEKLRRTCREQREGLAELLTGGGVSDYAAYSKAVGAVQALDLVLNEIAEIEKKYIEQ
jgi:hypothetical protein